MTGYKGRTGIYEMMLMSDELRAQALAEPDPRKLRAIAMRGGMRPLRLSGAQRVAQGDSTLEEVLRNAPPIER